MNKRIFTPFLLCSLLLSIQAHAAFTLSGTRFIYEEGKRNISMEVTNNTQNTFGGQVWVENTAQENKDEVYFAPAPAFFRIDGGQKQVVRLLNVNNKLPKDRESVFWINVQEIPPASKEEGSKLAIALNTRVKLLYRPKALAEGRENAEKGLQVSGDVLKNPTPYWFAVTGVMVNGQKIKLEKDKETELAMLAPFGEVHTGQKLAGNVKVEAIDDYGARRNYDVK